MRVPVTGRRSRRLWSLWLVCLLACPVSFAAKEKTPEEKHQKEAERAHAEYLWDAKQLDWVPQDPKDFGTEKGLFPKVISLGGGQTLVHFGGFIQANGIYDFQVAGNRYELIPSSMPVPTIHESDTLFNLRSSRFTFEARSDTGSDHAARAYFEMDMLGSTDTSSVEPRLRQLWAATRGCSWAKPGRPGWIW